MCSSLPFFLSFLFYWWIMRMLTTAYLGLGKWRVTILRAFSLNQLDDSVCLLPVLSYDCLHLTVAIKYTFMGKALISQSMKSNLILWYDYQWNHLIMASFTAQGKSKRLENQGDSVQTDRQTSSEVTNISEPKFHSQFSHWVSDKSPHADLWKEIFSF